MARLGSGTILLAALVACTALPAAAQQPPAMPAVLAANVSDHVPSSCAVSRPPNPAYRPPAPYPAQPPRGQFWFGTDKLWISLPANGVWALAHYRPGETAFRQKLLWYRKGFNPRLERRPKLTVTGQRLDAPAPPLAVDGPNAAETGDQSFMTVGFSIPTVGCWEIEGNYEGDKLSFVVWVEGVHPRIP
jgi:hypothetical protein